MPEGTGLSEFAEAYPERFMDVGIAEQHAVNFCRRSCNRRIQACGSDISPPFLQRAYDQIIHDVCLPNLPVVFAIDRGGLVGEDGPTHHGHFDITYLRNLPNMTLMAPKDENELRHMIYTALKASGPVAIRYPRGKGLGAPLDTEYRSIPMGEAEILREGEDLMILAIGNTVYPSMEAAADLQKEGISVGVVNCRFASPLDKNLGKIAGNIGRILVVEENIRKGGARKCDPRTLE